MKYYYGTRLVNANNIEIHEYDYFPNRFLSADENSDDECRLIRDTYT